MNWSKDGQPLDALFNLYLNRALLVADRADALAAEGKTIEAALCELIAREFAAMVCPEITNFSLIYKRGRDGRGGGNPGRPGPGSGAKTGGQKGTCK